MSDEPEASDIFGLIPVDFVEQSVGAVKNHVFAFVAVQRDESWMQWYAFFERLSPSKQAHLDIDLIIGGHGSTSWLGWPGGRNYHRSWLHLTNPLRVDQLGGEHARLFARNGRGESVFVTIEVTRKDGLLRLMSLHLQRGNRLPRAFNASGFKGSLIAVTAKPERFIPGKLRHPPDGVSYLFYDES